jgi:hypothetical protein
MAEMLAPLHTAVSKGDMEAAKRFLAKNSAPGLVNQRDHLGRTPLYLAVQAGNRSLVRWLLSVGGDPGLTDDNGLTPLYQADNGGFETIRSLLESHGAAYSDSDFLKRPLEPGNAFTWYVSRNVWLVRTAGHALVFNFLPPAKYSIGRTGMTFIADGDINPVSLRNLKTVHFLSHKPAGSFNRHGLSYWGVFIPDAAHVLAWPPEEEGKRQMQTWPGHRFDPGKVQVRTVRIGGGALGYWAKVDGLVLFYAGKDLVDRGEDIKKQLEQVCAPAKELGPVDIVFLQVHGSKEHPSTKAALTFLEAVNPRMMFPLYAGDGSHYYREFPEEIKNRRIKTSIGYARKKGQRFECLVMSND